MSNRLTKDEARRLSYELISTRQQAVEAAKANYEAVATDLYNATIPKDVETCYKKNPRYFSTSSSIYLDSYGFHREYVSVKDGGEVICFDGETELKLTRETASELLKAKRAYEKEKDAVEKLRKEIMQALINLHTYKRIIEQFPEAEPHLPKKYSPPAINYNQLKPVVKELVTEYEKQKSITR